MPALDPSAVASPAARDVLWRFMLQREVNREFYRRLPAEKLDCRMANSKTGRSDSPRDSLLHQLYVVRNYVYSVRTGVMQWGPEREALLMVPALGRWEKSRLLAEMERSDQELIDLLVLPDLDSRTVRVRWQDEPVPAVRLLEGLIDHEILHTGWNRALMEHLQVERYPALGRLWN